MSRREQGRQAVEVMLKHGVPVVEINNILKALPSLPFTSGAYERLLDEQMKRSEVKS